MRNPPWTCSLLWSWLLLLSACHDAPDTDGRTPVRVFAASSLTEAFAQLEREYEAEHPDIDVQLSFAGSQVLRLQLEQGARADLFASANEAHMRALQAAGVIARSQPFAHNELVVIVPASNPAAIAAFADLPRARRLVIGTENVPIGIYTREILRRASARLDAGFGGRVLASVVSQESNVRLVRAKVELGEADAAVVYRTDAQATDRLKLIPIPAELNVAASYPMGVLARAPQPAAAKRFVDFVLSPRGQRALGAHGFIAPGIVAARP